jgi:hypothetical protein
MSQSHFIAGVATVFAGLGVAAGAAWAAPAASRAIAAAAASAEAPKTAPAGKGKIRYRESARLQFDDLLVQGRFNRPEVLIVTGDTQKEGASLLRLRKDFADRMSAELGEAAR